MFCRDGPLCVQGKVVEPLSDFHKDEVRALGETLGLPRKMLYRHPFPGEWDRKRHNTIMAS